MTHTTSRVSVGPHGPGQGKVGQDPGPGQQPVTQQPPAYPAYPAPAPMQVSVQNMNIFKIMLEYLPLPETCGRCEFMFFKNDLDVYMKQVFHDHAY